MRELWSADSIVCTMHFPWELTFRMMTSAHVSSGGRDAVHRAPTAQAAGPLPDMAARCWMAMICPSICTARDIIQLPLQDKQA